MRLKAQILEPNGYNSLNMVESNPRNNELSNLTLIKEYTFDEWYNLDIYERVYQSCNYITLKNKNNITSGTYIKSYISDIIMVDDVID